MTRRKLTKATLEIIPVYFPSHDDQLVILGSLEKLEQVLFASIEKLQLTKQLYKQLQREAVDSMLKVS